MSKTNPTNSTLVQFLADLAKLGINKATTLQELATMAATPSFRSRFDEQWKIHDTYNQDRIKTVRVSCDAAITQLDDPSAVKLFLLLATHVHQSGYIQAARHDLMDAAGMSANTLDRAMKKLVANGFITKRERRGKPCLYHLNTNDVDCGKLKDQALKAMTYTKALDEATQDRYKALAAKAHEWYGMPGRNMDDPARPFGITILTHREQGDQEQKNKAPGPTGALESPGQGTNQSTTHDTSNLPDFQANQGFQDLSDDEEDLFI